MFGRKLRRRVAVLEADLEFRRQKAREMKAARQTVIHPSQETRRPEGWEDPKRITSP